MQIFVDQGDVYDGSNSPTEGVNGLRMVYSSKVKTSRLQLFVRESGSSQDFVPVDSGGWNGSAAVTLNLDGLEYYFLFTPLTGDEDSAELNVF